MISGGVTGPTRGWLLLLLALAACSKERDTPDAARAKPAPAVATVAPPPVDAGLDAPPPGAVLVVTTEPLQAGTSSTITFEANLDFDLNLGGFQTVTTSKQSKKKTVAITAVDADGTVHKRITYIKRKTDILVDGEPKKDPTILPGKTFRVAFKDGVVDVKRANGKAATPAEVDAVKAEEILLQTPEMLGKTLAGLRLVENQQFEVPVAMMSALVISEYKARRVVLTYRGQEGDAARLAAQVSLASEGEGMKMFVDLDADLLMDRTGWCRELDVTAQVRAEFAGQVVGSGAGFGQVRATPLR